MFKNLFKRKKNCLIQHAEKELSLIGYDGTDKLNNLAKKSIIELLTTLSKQGHSGFSNEYVVDIFNKLAKYEVLSPLTGKDDEWVRVSNGVLIGKVDECDDHPLSLYQNNRNSAVFKTSGETYYLDAIVWIDENGIPFTNYHSKGYIKSFPFTPKTFYVKVDKDRNILDKDEYEKAKEYYEFKQRQSEIGAQ